ncbi:hypothetical protein CE161_09905 [Bifidobacterium longum]|nr:hypothetical protein CE161_09905 [Bifidobacterium longum]
MRFWAPGSPPQAFLPGAIRCPSCPRAGRVPVRRRGGAWWLENWIVDASKARVFWILVLLLISNRTLLFVSIVL